jgi:hypothetical protein
MKTLIVAASLALGLGTAALAQAPAPAPAPAAATGKLSVQTTKISEIIKNAAAKTALEKALPEISQYYEQVGDMTLAEVAPMSGGAIDDAKLKALQAEFDKLA